MRVSKLLSICIIFLSLFLSVESVFASDCDCPKVTCGPCQKKVSVGKVVKFCDWGDINVCKKVICENVNFYFGCISKYQKELTQEENKANGDLKLIYDTVKTDPSKAKRSTASQKNKKKRGVELNTPGRVAVGNESRVIAGEEYSDVVIANVKNMYKGLEVIHRGKKQALKKGQKLYVSDHLVNPKSKSKKLTVNFSTGHVVLTLSPKSKVIVSDPNSILGRFQPFFYLVYGGVKAEVSLEQGSFDLLAGQVLARIPNGQAQVNYEMGVEGLRVKIESLKGQVKVIKADDLSGQAIAVAQGEFVSWVSETPKELFDFDERQALRDEGFITPVFQMSLKKRKQLGLVAPPVKNEFANWNEKPPIKDGKRMPASLAEGLCQLPSANYRQCAWSCEGNKKGAKVCQADQKNVHCVRRICNAAGQWGEATAFATSYADLCPAEGVRVGECQP